MDAVIAANGTLAAGERLVRLWREAELRIAADGGARNAREHLGRAPHVVVGDLDSLDDSSRAWLTEHHAEFIQHPVAKDETDLELAVLLARARGATRITVLGALGGRPDQHIANVLLLSRWPGLVLLDTLGEMWTAERETIVRGETGDIVSLIPFDAQVEGVVTRDLLYPLLSETLLRGSTRGVSNEMLAPVCRVEWDTGLLLIVHLFRA